MCISYCSLVKHFNCYPIMEGKPKISFSFSKITKKPAMAPAKPAIVKKVDKIQFIDCLEDNSIKVIDEETSEVKSPLVIPMLVANELQDNMIKAVKARKAVASNIVDNPNTVSEVNGNSDGNCLNVKEQKETLDEMAAREIIEEIEKDKMNKPEAKSDSLVVPLNTESTEKKESTLEDYESIPVNDFGLAMLRGMGWNPAKGIGKNEQIVKVTAPTVRPKGMGLGADKVIMTQKPTSNNVDKKEVLKVNSKIRITYGQYKNLYGTIISLDENAGRVSVKLSLGNEIISINESFVQLVNLDEFNKYANVININTYKRYQENEEKSIRQSSDKSNSCVKDNVEESKNFGSDIEVISPVEQSPLRISSDSDNSRSYRKKKTSSKSIHKKKSRRSESSELEDDRQRKASKHRQRSITPVKKYKSRRRSSSSSASSSDSDHYSKRKVSQQSKSSRRSRSISPEKRSSKKSKKSKHKRNRSRSRDKSRRK